MLDDLRAVPVCDFGYYPAFATTAGASGGDELETVGGCQWALKRSAS